jgi:integrase
MSVKVVYHDGYVKIHYQNKSRVRIPTGVSLSNKNQLSESGKLTRDVPDRIDKQSLIDNIKLRLSNLIQEYLVQYGIPPTGIEVKRLFENYKEKHQSTYLLLPLFQEFFKLKELEFSDPDFSKNSIKDYRGLQYYLEDYETHTEKKITLNDVTLDWMKLFKLFLVTPRVSTTEKSYKTKGGIKNSTLKKKLGLFVYFLKWLNEKDLIPSPSNIGEYVKKLKNNVTVKTTLSKTEILNLYKHKFKQTKYTYIRDVFVFSCYTGLRWSDLSSLHPRNIKEKNGQKYIYKKSIKTKSYFSVFLNRISEEIGNRYNYTFNNLENSDFNKYLKILLKETRLFDDLCSDEMTPRYQNISIHRGRDIFITLLLEERVPLNVIMKYTGHKSLSNLEKYIDRHKDDENFTHSLIP